MKFRAAISFVLGGLVGCTSVADPLVPPGAFAGTAGNGVDAVSMTPSPPTSPDERTLCQISFGASTRDDIASVLGPTPDTRETDDDVLLQYTYADGVMLLLHIRHDVFDLATVYGAPYPQCWVKQERARDEAAFEEAMHPDGGRAEQQDGSI